MILILDFGSQYTQLIARRIRESKVYSEVVPHTITAEEVVVKKPLGIILSGGPASIYDDQAPNLDTALFNLNIPLLGICYGLQLIVEHFEGQVEQSQHQEYGQATINIEQSSRLFKTLASQSNVWMSHGDSVTKVPQGFESCAHTQHCPVTAIQNTDKNIYGIQFHPEVHHSQDGSVIIANFLFDICKAKPDWSSESFIEDACKHIQKTVGKSHVICGLSGGVDSSVVAVLMHKAIGKNLTCIYIDHGMMRKDETKHIKALFTEKYAMNVCYVDASDYFLSRLEGISDPEKKRKIIGECFIRTFEKEAKKLGSNYHFLAQGTLYPDIIESAAVGVAKTAKTIKTHHNVGGLPEKMDFKIIEPVKMLFKDEVRQVGLALGMPQETIERHPFPGPGLSIRILGEITKEKIKRLQDADAIFIEELKKNNLYTKIWQALAVLLPIKTVGVKGDSRSYEYTLALRAVESLDAMTANWFHMPQDVLAHISTRILNEVPGLNRIVYDITNKPPGTIEWE